jgi:hypothetical protein
MNKIIKDLLTGKDNKTHDIARWSWMVSTIAIIAGFAYQLHHGVNIGIREFAEAIGIIAGAHGAAVLMKKDAEPTQTSDTNIDK